MTPSALAPFVRAAGAVAVVLSCTGCPTAQTPEGDCPPTGEKWYLRASQEFGEADVDEAHDAIGKALAVCPADPRLKVLAARIALSRLDYAETVRQLKNVPGSESAGLRGRALWYRGDLDAAADQLEAMLNDPEVKDDWAKSIAKLARRGQGRQPFAISGGLLAVEEMPHVSPMAPYFVVPLEIDGEPALALISTGQPEVVLDSATRQEPSWVSLRFGKRLEVRDVPALTQDLSGISKALGAPGVIKALLGVNLLRHLNVTIDYTGHQFVARTFTPPPPPSATRLDLSYVRGGGMVIKGGFSDKEKRAALFVDTSQGFPLALDQEGWKKAGIDVATLKLVPDDPSKKLREGVVPILRLGAYDVPKVPGVYGAPMAELEKQLGQNLDGVLGAGLLAYFRITLADGGRRMWIEDNSAVVAMLQQQEANPMGPPAPAPPPAALPPAEAPPTATPPKQSPAPSKAPSNPEKAPSKSGPKPTSKSDGKSGAVGGAHAGSKP